MNPIIAWLLKDVLLPLTPVICGTAVRYINYGELEFELTELSFSMAVLFMIQIKSIGKKAATSTDHSLIEGLMNSAIVAIIICLLVFTVSVGQKIETDNSMRNLIDIFVVELKKGTTVIKLKQAIENYKIFKNSGQSDRLKIFMYALTIVSIPLAGVFKFYYKLED
jgi:hypothetical protein